MAAPFGDRVVRSRPARIVRKPCPYSAPRARCGIRLPHKLRYWSEWLLWRFSEVPVCDLPPVSILRWAFVWPQLVAGTAEVAHRVSRLSSTLDWYSRSLPTRFRCRLRPGILISRRVWAAETWRRLSGIASCGVVQIILFGGDVPIPTRAHSVAQD